MEKEDEDEDDETLIYLSSPSCHGALVVSFYRVEEDFSLGTCMRLCFTLPRFQPFGVTVGGCIPRRTPAPPSWAQTRTSQFFPSLRTLILTQSKKRGVG